MPEYAYGLTFMTTADERTLGRWTATAGVAIASAVSRVGAYAFKFTASDGYLRKTQPYSGPLMLYVRVTSCMSSADAGRYITINFKEDAASHVNLLLDFGAGSLTVRRDATTLASFNPALLLDTWYCLEFGAEISNAAGTCAVKLDGANVDDLTLADVDTRNGGNGRINTFEITGDVGAYIKEVVIRDDALPGVGYQLITTITDEADSVNLDWEASAGTPDACVDEIPASFTDYIHADNYAEDDAHAFVHSALPVLSITKVHAVAVVALAKLAADEAGTVRTYYADPVLESSMRTDAFKLSDEGQFVVGYWDANSSAEDLDVTQIDRSHFGVQVSVVV